MERRFLSADGDLACKLMAAMQGAKRVGADSRCAPNGSSSLFAYVKVAQPGDVQGAPSMVVGVRTREGARVEPIDSLQVLFDAEHSCQASRLKDLTSFEQLFDLLPTPASDFITITNKTADSYKIDLLSITGNVVRNDQLDTATTIEVNGLTSGIYILRIEGSGKVYSKMVLIQG